MKGTLGRSPRVGPEGGRWNQRGDILFGEQNGGHPAEHELGSQTVTCPGPPPPAFPPPPQEEGSQVDKEIGKSELLQQWLLRAYITLEFNPLETKATAINVISKGFLEIFPQDAERD